MNIQSFRLRNEVKVFCGSITALSLILLLIFFISGCGNKDEESQLKIFHYNQPGGISSLDPAFSGIQANFWAINQLFNGLIQEDSNLKIIPCIAKRWIISDDGLTYTFFLRSDVTFHDHELFAGGKGRRVVATDFVYSFQRIIDPNTASTGAWIFNDKVDVAEPFKSIDDTTFQIKLKQPFPPLMGLLAMQYCSVVPHEATTHYGKDFRSHPVGTGPFYLKVWKEDVVLLLFRNENYFEKDESGNSLPYLDGVRITFIDSKATEFLKFRQGEYDFINDIDPSFKDDVLTIDGDLQAKYQNMFKLLKATYLNTEYIGMKMDDSSGNNPLRIKEVRQAINYAIDKEKMMLYLRNSVGVPAQHGMVPLGIAGYSNEKVEGYHFDLMKARQLIDKAGFSNEHPMPVIKLYCNSTGEVLANFIAGQLKEAGIPVQAETMQGKALRELMIKGKAAFFRASWIADYPDPENYLVLFYSKAGAPPNYTRYKNKQFDEMYEASFKMVNDSLRYNSYLQMEKTIIEDAPIVPLYYDQSVRLVQSYVTGLVNNPKNMLTLKYVSFQ